MTVLTLQPKAADWSMRHPQLWGTRLNAIASSPKMCVAVGRDGQIVHSSDGVNWSSQIAGGTNRHFSDVIYANSKFVAVGALYDAAGVHSLAMSSSDGVNWTEHATDSRAWKSVAFGAGRFVAVGDHTVDISEDGITWTRRTPQAYLQFAGVAYGNGSFVTMGVWNDGRGNFYYGVQRSSDGVTWTGGPAPAASALRGIAFGNGEFAMAGDNGLIFTSPDGLEWTQQASRTGTLNDIAFVNGMFVAVGSGGESVRSSDGIDWFQATSTEPCELHGAGAAFGRLLAVGDHAAVISSSDGQNWSSPVAGTYHNLRGVTFGGGRWIAVGDHAEAVSSSDGQAWSSHPILSSTDGLPSTWFNAVAFGAGHYVAVGGQGGAIFTSSDAQSWTERNWNLGADDWLGAAYANGRFVVVGAASVGYGPLAAIRTSTDGVAWSTTRPGTPAPLRCVAQGNGVWVAAGVDLFSSTDAANWTQRSLPATGTVNAGAFGAGRFVLAGDVGGVVASVNGTTWTHHTAFGDSQIHGLAFGNNQFIAVGQRDNAGVIWSSADGLSWAQEGSAPAPLKAVSFANGTFTAVGDRGLVLQSTATTARLAIQRLGDGTVEISCRAEPGRQCRLQSSADGRNWDDLKSFRATASDPPYRDSLGNRPMRLYRLVSP